MTQLINDSVAKRVFRNLKRTADIGLYFQKTQDSMKGYVELDWGNFSDKDLILVLYSSLVRIQFLGNQQSNKLVPSSPEAEYVALTRKHFRL